MWGFLMKAAEAGTRLKVVYSPFFVRDTVRSNRRGGFHSQAIISGFWAPRWATEFQIRSMKSGSLPLGLNPILAAVSGLGVGMLLIAPRVKCQNLGASIIWEVAQLRSGTLSDCFTGYRPAEKYLVFADRIFFFSSFFSFLDGWNV